MAHQHKRRADIERGVLLSISGKIYPDIFI